MHIIKAKEKPLIQELADHNLSRRRFMKFAGIMGASAAVVGGLTACDNDDDDDDGVNLGSGDTGILNYAYALEQLEAAFYTRVITSQYSGITAQETAYLTDIRDHEIAHREFFKKVLSSNAIPGLEVDFSSIDFGSRTSVLGAAQAFEDLGVAAYNGAGQLISDANNLLLAGKIVSVEARHAALIRELVSANSFAPNTVDAGQTPSQVLATAGVYVKTKLNASNLPTS